MQKNDDDPSLDRLLQQALPELMTTAEPDSCLDAETVAAWTEGALPGSQAVLVETHLSRCARCQHLVATLVRTTPTVMPAATPTEPLWRRWRLQWLVPALASATAVALWIAVPADRPSVVPQQAPQPAAQAPQPAASARERTAPAPERTASAPEREGRASGARADSSIADELGRQEDRRAVEPNRDANEPSTLEARADEDVAKSVAAEADTTRDQAMSNAQAARAPAAPAAPAAGPAEEPVPFVQRLLSASPDIVSPNPANRWRIVAGTRVERSTTGGSTWEAVVMGAPVELTTGVSPAPLVCWLVGRAGAVWLTTDGTRFERVPFPASVNLVGVRATSGDSVVVTAADGRTFRTDSRGATWRLER